MVYDLVERPCASLHTYIYTRVRYSDINTVWHSNGVQTQREFREIKANMILTFRKRILKRLIKLQRLQFASCGHSGTRAHTKDLNKNPLYFN